MIRQISRQDLTQETEAIVFHISSYLQMTKQAIWLDTPVFGKFAQVHYARITRPLLFAKGWLCQICFACQWLAISKLIVSGYWSKVYAEKLACLPKEILYYLLKIAEFVVFNIHREWWIFRDTKIVGNLWSLYKLIVLLSTTTTPELFIR